MIEMTERLAGPLILVPRNLVPMQESHRKFSLGLFGQGPGAVRPAFSSCSVHLILML